MDFPGAKRRYLLLPECEDRATLFLNGRRIGLWGRGPGGQREPIFASFRKGPNTLTMLVDNLGRFDGGSRLGQGKGLLSEVFDGKAIRARKFKLKQAEGFSKRIVPRHMAHRVGQLRTLPVFEAETSLSMKTVRPVLMSFEGIDADVCVFCNERNLGFFERGRTNWGDLTLTASLKKGSNKIRMVLWGDVSEEDLKKVRFYSLAEAITSEGKWSYRPWRKPAEVSAPPEDVEQGLPCWYISGFQYDADERPLFLEMACSGKGQVFLNGRNLGRWWSAGPQKRYYLPGSLLSEDNELLVFSEAGPAPEGAKLVFCPRGPYDV
jgi:hypothetical protein